MNDAKVIKEYREKVLITQAELAKILDVSFLSFNRWERGRFEPTMGAKRKLKGLFEEEGIVGYGKKK